MNVGEECAGCDPILLRMIFMPAWVDGCLQVIGQQLREALNPDLDISKDVAV